MEGINKYIALDRVESGGWDVRGWDVGGRYTVSVNKNVVYQKVNKIYISLLKLD